MKRLFITLLVFLLINSYQLKSQINPSVDKWMEYVDEMAQETEDTEHIKTLYADLSYLSEHPFELNTVTEEQLKRLPFLSDLQIKELLEYRLRYGKLVTVYELKNIVSFDFETISLFLSFVYISEFTVEKRPFTVKNLFKYGSNDLQIRYDRCFQQKKGYCSYPDSVLSEYPNRSYLGEPFYHSLRYSYIFDERLQFGFVAEKDAGEPFWNDSHKGYDYYSIHLLLKDMAKWLKSLALGDYKVSFGQGLIVSNDFTPGRSAQVTQAERRSNGFRKHFSTNENDFFRGIASTVSFGKFDISMFCSFRKLDAKVDSNQIRSFKTDGLHRLPGDREKIRKAPMCTYGGNIRYATPSLCLGITALSYSFGNMEVQPDLKPYNLYYFRGGNNFNIGVDYLLKIKSMKLYGETAVSANGACATLNAFQLTPVSYFSFLMLYRYYDLRYQAFFGNAFSQNSMIQNEQGVYIGMQWTPFARWKLSAYADLFRFPWLKYGMDAPSDGKEYMCQIDYHPAKDISMYFRYRYKQKNKNGLEEETTSLLLLPSIQQRLRLQFLYTISPSVSLRTSVDGVFNKETEKRSSGWMLAQSMGWKPVKIPFQADLYAAFFHTDDYYSRISSYEKNILYAFNSSFFYGKGFRGAISLRWDFLKRFTFSTKWAYSYYLDRDKIGTNQEEINGPVKTDLYALLRCKF